MGDVTTPETLIPFSGDDWFDPLEEAMRLSVRGFIEAMVDEELRPDRTSAEHQSLLHFVGQSPWDEVALLRAVRAAVLPVLTAAGPAPVSIHPSDTPWSDR